MTSTTALEFNGLPKLELTFVKSDHSKLQSGNSNRKRLTNLSTLPNDVRDTLKDFEKSVGRLSNQLSILEALGGTDAVDQYRVSRDVTSFCELTQKLKELSTSMVSRSESSLYRSYIVISIQQDVARQVYETKLILNPALLKLFLEQAAMGPLPLHLHRKYKMVETNMKRIRQSISSANKLLRKKEATALETPSKATDGNVDVLLSSIENQFTSIQQKISTLEAEVAELERQKKERSPTKFNRLHRNNICYQLHQLNLNGELEETENIAPPESLNGSVNDIEKDTAEYDDCDVSLNTSALIDGTILQQESPIVDRSATGVVLHSYGSLSIDENELLLRSRAVNTDISATPGAPTPIKRSRSKGFNNASYWHQVKLNVLKDKRPSFSLRSFEAFFEEDTSPSGASAVSTSDVISDAPTRIPSSWRRKIQLLNHSTVASVPLRVSSESLGDWRHVQPCVRSTTPASSTSSAPSGNSKPAVSPLVEALRVIEAYTTTEAFPARPTGVTSATKPSVNPFASSSSGSGAESGSVNVLTGRSRATRAVDSGNGTATAAPVVDGNLVAIRSTYKRSDSVLSDDAPPQLSMKASVTTPAPSASAAVSSGDSKRANRSGSLGLGDRTASGDEEGVTSVDKTLGTIQGTNMLDITKKGSVSSPSSSAIKTLPTMAIVADVDMTVAQITEAIHTIYQQHNPSKVDEIPKLLAKYKDRELEMLNKVRAKYNVPGNSAKVTTSSPSMSSGSGFGRAFAGGITVNTNDANNQPLEKLAPPDSSPRLSNTRSSSVFDLSGLNNTPTGSTGKNPFAKTDSPKSAGGAAKNLFGLNASPVRTSPSSTLATGFGGGPATSLFANKPNAAGFGSGNNSGTTTPFGLNATSSGGIGLAASGTGSVFGGGFQSPFKQSTTPSNGGFGAPAAQTTPNSLQEVQSRVTAIYQQYNPMKISEIPSLMEKYRGRELQLIANLEKKYNVPPATTAAVVTPGSGFGMNQMNQGSLFNRSATVGGNASPFANATPTSGGNSLFSNKVGSAGVGGTVSPFAQQQNPTPFGQQAQPTNLNSLFQGSMGVMGTQSPFGKSALGGGSTSLNPLGIAGTASSGSSLFGNATNTATPFGGGFNNSVSSGSSGNTSLFSGSASNSSSLFNRSPQTPFGQQPQMLQQQQQQQLQQQSTPNSLQEVQSRVTAIYQQYNPMKISEIPSLMEKYRGRELQLIANLEKKYNVPPGGMGASATGVSGFGGLGGPQQSPFGQPSGGLFGNASASVAVPGGSLFGSSPQQQQTGSLFGSTMGGGPQQSPFGVSQPQQSPFGGNSQTSSGFGGNSGFGVSSGFGATPPQQTPFGQPSGFGGSANTFGTASPQQPTSLFGNKTTPGGATGALSLFNRSPLQPQQQQQASPFGNAASRTTSGFGTPTPFGNAAGTASSGGSLFGNRAGGTTAFGSTSAVGWGGR